MSFPQHVKIYEVGPREGFQIEDALIPTTSKVELINELNETGLTSIEVTSFVNPKWVPNMADAEALLLAINRELNVDYRTVYLNLKGLERAFAANVKIDGCVSLSASSTFAKRNTNKTTDELIQTIPAWVESYKAYNIPVEQLIMMATFGCNFEGEIELAQVMNILKKGIDLATEHGETIRSLKLCDTMGWANPEQIKRTIFAIKNMWPELELILHLHDTRGLGIANAYSALQEGVNQFDAAIGGLGGCPFAAVKGAAGNVATEDLAFLCENLGIDTGLNLEKLLNCVNLAETILARPLQGHLKTGGLLLQKDPV
ncbi:MAG: hydroxymethylglutaryl-CoA lyase [Solibacillus sp.]